MKGALHLLLLRRRRRLDLGCRRRWTCVGHLDLDVSPLLGRKGFLERERRGSVINFAFSRCVDALRNLLG